MKTFIFCTLLFSLLLNCAKKEPARIPESHVLARIGDRIITKNDFIQRAEYTIRPPYCKNDNYVHKKIVLNSLIAEKLFAMEGVSSQLAQNQKFQHFIQGRKEQAMRQVFFQRHMYDPVELEDKEVAKVYDKAGREYDIEFVTIENEPFNQTIEQEVHGNGKSLPDAIRSVTRNDSLELPSRKITFDPDEIPEVMQALYENEVSKGQTIGPLMAGGQHVWMYVKGWTEKVAVASQDLQNRSEDVRQYLTYKYAVKNYENYVRNLMKGKEVKFNQDTFIALVNTLGPVYFPKQSEKEKEISKGMFGKEPEPSFADSLSIKLGEMEDQPLLTIDGQIWTIRDLDRELMLHPLQFRQKNFPQNKFGEQLKLAIVDLIKDKYITQDAYEEGLDDHPAVKLQREMWRDAYLASYHRSELLNSMGIEGDFAKEYLSILENHLNPVVDSLQQKYADVIEINTDLFEDIELTRIDMFAMYNDQPYSVVVPQFPVLTTDTRLDYGRKMEVSEK